MLTVRSYLSQILHGCKSAYCETPTCLSSSRRNASKPTRPPTQLTARALAHYLASQGNPRQGLCPHELKVLPASLEIQGAVGAGTRQAGDGGCVYSVYPAIRHVSSAEHGVAEAIKQRHQTRMDTQSLSQNLFNSITMIFSYSRQLPSPASVLDAIRSSVQIPSSANGIVRANSSSVTSQTPLSAPDTAEHSLQDSHHDAATSYPKVLDNGHHVHRIPYDLRNTRSEKMPKLANQKSLDGATDGPLFTKQARTKEPLGVTGASISWNEPQPTPAKESAPASTVPVASSLNCDSLEDLKEDVYQDRGDQSPDLYNFVVDYDSKRHFRPSTTFANRSLFYTLSDTDTLLESFHDSNDDFAFSPLPHLDSARLAHCFRDWDRRNGALVFDSLWNALDALFVPPLELDVQKSPRLRPSRKGASSDSSMGQSRTNTAATPRYLSTHEAAHVVMICIHALTSLVRFHPFQPAVSAS
jgi:hypothetical protein